MWGCVLVVLARNAASWLEFSGGIQRRRLNVATGCWALAIMPEIKRSRPAEKATDQKAAESFTCVFCLRLSPLRSDSPSSG